MGKVNIKNFEKAIKGTRGIITLIAKNLGVERLTVYKFLEKNKKGRELLEAEKEKVVDMAENKLHQALVDGQTWAIKTVLIEHNRGQARGYGQKMDIEHTGQVQQNIDKIKVEIIETQENKNADA